MHKVIFFCANCGYFLSDVEFARHAVLLAVRCFLAGSQWASASLGKAWFVFFFLFFGGDEHDAYEGIHDHHHQHDL